VVLFRLLADVAAAQELPRDVLPLFLRAVPTDPVGRETVVAPAQDPLAARAPQDVDQMGGPEALPDALGARQEHLRRNRVVDLFDRRATDVAAGTVLARERLVEVGQERAAAAARAGRPVDHQPELLPRDPSLERRRLLVDEVVVLHRVAVAVE